MSIADKLTTIAENEQKVYDAGYYTGLNSGGGSGGFEGTTGVVLDITTVANAQFKGLKGITEMRLPNVVSIGTGAFVDSDIEMLDIGANLKNYATTSFAGARKLNKLIIRSGNNAITNSISLAGTPIYSGKGYIYVPDEYVEHYKTKVFTNQNLVNQVKPLSEIEGSGGEGGPLQSKTVTPTKQQQKVTPDSGNYGLSEVTVESIPDEYQDVSGVTAKAENVLSGVKFVASDGTVVTGSMINRHGLNRTLTTITTSFNIPEGYHSGAGIIKIELEDEKTVSPTQEKQIIMPSSGKVLSKVTVEPVPDKYQDVSGVTAIADDVLKGKQIVTKDGELVEGAIDTVELIDKTLTIEQPIISIPKGYHEEKGTVSISTETRTETPNKTTQTIKPTSGKVLSEVTINPIPDEYQDVTGVTATPEYVHPDKKFVTADGELVSGTMANNGDVSAEIDGVDVTSVTIPAGYTGGGVITFKPPFNGVVYPCVTINNTEIATKQYQNGVGLEGIRTVILPNVETINGAAFMNCTEVECFDIGANVQTVNSTAFNGCTRLTKLIIRGLITTKPMATSSPISNSAFGYVYVPDEYVEQYKANSNWSTWVDKIKPISELKGGNL